MPQSQLAWSASSDIWSALYGQDVDLFHEVATVQRVELSVSASVLSSTISHQCKCSPADAIWIPALLQMNSANVIIGLRNCIYAPQDNAATHAL